MSESLHFSYDAGGMLSGLSRSYFDMAAILYHAIKDHGDMIPKHVLVERFDWVMNNSPFGYLYTVSEMFKNLGELERRWKEGDMAVTAEFLSFYVKFPSEEDFEKINKSIDNIREKIDRLLERETEESHEI